MIYIFLAEKYFKKNQFHEFILKLGIAETILKFHYSTNLSDCVDRMFGYWKNLSLYAWIPWIVDFLCYLKNWKLYLSLKKTMKKLILGFGTQA